MQHINENFKNNISSLIDDVQRLQIDNDKRKKKIDDLSEEILSKEKVCQLHVEELEQLYEKWRKFEISQTQLKLENVNLVKERTEAKRRWDQTNENLVKVRKENDVLLREKTEAIQKWEEATREQTRLQREKDDLLKKNDKKLAELRKQNDKNIEYKRKFELSIAENEKINVMKAELEVKYDLVKDNNARIKNIVFFPLCVNGSKCPNAKFFERSQPRPRVRCKYDPEAMNTLMAWLKSSSIKNEELLICMFNFTHTTIVECLMQHWTMNKIRVLLYQPLGSDNGRGGHSETLEVAHTLRCRNINVRCYKSHGLMHNKFAVCGDEFLHGSLNWTRAVRHSQEIFTITECKEIAARFVTKFNELWDESSLEF